MKVPQGFIVLTSTNQGGQSGKIRVYHNKHLVFTKTWYTPKEMESLTESIVRTLWDAQKLRLVA